MRIISGFLKGKSIKYLKNTITRPLRDAVRENIFNILAHSKQIIPKIDKAKILDLYSGVGSFGLECISRGAEKVTFIENDLIAINTLKENLVSLSISNQAKIINNKVENVNLSKIERFNIIFLDPPFSNNHFVNDLMSLKKYKVFQKNHVVIIHREKSTNDNFEEILETILTKKYGRSKIIFGCFI